MLCYSMYLRFDLSEKNAACSLKVEVWKISQNMIILYSKNELCFYDYHISRTFSLLSPSSNSYIQHFWLKRIFHQKLNAWLMCHSKELQILLQSWWAIGIVEPQCNYAIWRWLPKWRFFETEIGLDVKGLLRVLWVYE